MRHEYDDLFQYALKDGKLVYVDSVSNGLECGCICPNCLQPLVAHNNPENKRAKHFQHQSLKGCEGVYETVIHYLAKEIIQEQGYLVIPDVDYFLSEFAQNYDSSITQSSIQTILSKQIHFDLIDVEKSVGEFRPDLKCSINGKTMYIEIAVTHFIDEKKKEKIFKDGSPVLEIDLSGENRILTKKQLNEILTSNIDKMKWIYNPKIRTRLLEKEKAAQEIKNFVSTNRKTLKVYGKNHEVYNCPIYKEHYDKIKIEDECYRCRYFVGELEGISPLGEEPKYRSRTVDCIGHTADDYLKILKTKGVTLRD